MRRGPTRRPNPLLVKPPVSFHKLGWHSQSWLDRGLESFFSREYLRDIYLGVHTTPYTDIAAWYALSAARKLHDVPILITIDTRGLAFEPDADALLRLNVNLGGSFRSSSLVKEWEAIFNEAEDANEALSVFEDNRDAQDSPEAAESISAEVFRVLEEDFNPFQGAIRYAEVAGLNADTVLAQFLTILSSTAHLVDAPLVRGVLAHGFPQHRVLEDVGPDRIVAIHTVGLVVDKPTCCARISSEEIDELNETAYEWGITMEEVPEHWRPKLALVYENPGLQGLRGEVEYHGTTLTQAAQALPELLAQVQLSPAPWAVVEQIEAALD